MRQALMDQALSGAVLFGETISSATRRAMLEDRRADAYEIMRAIGRQPGIDLVRVFNKDGKITFSSLPGEEGRVLDRTEESCRPCHEGPRARWPGSRVDRASRVVEIDGHRALHIITPTHSEPRCSAVRLPSPRPRRAGAGRPGGAGLARGGRSPAGHGALVSGWPAPSLGVTLLGGTLVAFARRRVLQPVAALLEGTRRIARDQLDQEIEADERGELGVLARSFNEMTRALRRVEGDLKALNVDLEQKVEDRTADLRRAQAALVQTEKLSSLGQLSASIAHEINNPLAGILTFAKLVTRELETAVTDPDKRATLTRNLALVEREAGRCSAIVRNLLDFARERPLKLEAVDVNAAVEESLQLVGHKLNITGFRLEQRLLRTLPRRPRRLRRAAAGGGQPRAQRHGGDGGGRDPDRRDPDLRRRPDRRDRGRGHRPGHPARASPARSSIPSSPPRRRGPAWGCRWSTASCSGTADESTWRARRATGPAS